jgi:hypothetical protein
MHGARSCVFENCRFSNLGTFAIDVMAGCTDVTIAANEVGPVAAGGIRVNGGTERDPPWQRTRDIAVVDNWVHHYGVDYPSAVGVLVMNA